MSAISPLTGQIRRGETVGELLYNLVKQDDIHVILDIGTWKGMGTTKCILDGIMESKKKSFEVFSIECNKLFHEEAKVNLGFLPPKFHLLHGSLFDPKLLYPKREELKDVPLSWLEADIQGMKTSENHYDKIPKSLDLLVIDGGEFSGEIEFGLFWERSKYIFLDDTASPKNENNREFILANPETFEVLYDNTLERALICKNLKYGK